LGADVYMSGTVAAVREAALLGKPGIAISHYVRRGVTLDWAQAGRWSAAIIASLLAQEHVPGTYWNVNLPHLAPGEELLPEQVFCRLDPHALPVYYRQEKGRLLYFGDYHGRARDPGADVDVCFSGRISVTRLSVR
jgi:5'-nucleotidase